jgi:hypothetical protein
VTFRNKFIFYGEDLLSPRPTPKLEDHLLFSLCMQFLYILAPFGLVPRQSARCDASVNENFVEVRVEMLAILLFHVRTEVGRCNERRILYM